MILIGQHILSINKQGQLNLPSSLCAALQNHAYITQGFDRNLLLMTGESFERLYSQIKNTSISDPLARLLVRMFLANAVELHLDASGQVQVPSALQEYAGAEDKVVVVGQGDYFELWAPAKWNEQSVALGSAEANVDRFTKFNLAAA